MSTYQIETHLAFRDRSLASNSLAFIDSSLYGDWFVVSTILPPQGASELNSRSNGVELNTPPILENASTFGKIDTLKFVCQDSPGQPNLSSVIRYLYLLNLLTSQFSKWYISFSSCTPVNKGICYGMGRVYVACLLLFRLLANPPVQIVENRVKMSVSPNRKDVALDCCHTECHAGSNLVVQLKNYLWQSFARLRGQFQNSKLLSKLLQQTDRNSDTLFTVRTLDRPSDNNTAILNDDRSSTDKTLPSLYRLLALHSTLEALLA